MQPAEPPPVLVTACFFATVIGNAVSTSVAVPSTAVIEEPAEDVTLRSTDLHSRLGPRAQWVWAPNSLVPIGAKLSILHCECRPVVEAMRLVLQVC
jgi:hypothetical protein